ncbi:hypothetical protein Tco_1485729 [Tanacetum coccineum]
MRVSAPGLHKKTRILNSQYGDSTCLGLRMMSRLSLKNDMPLRDKFEVGESSSATAARKIGHTLAHRVDYGFVDIVDASICAFESRATTVVHCKDTQDDRALLRAQAWVYSKTRSQAIEAQIRALQGDVDVLQRQRIRDEERLTRHIQHKHNRFRELKISPKRTTTATSTAPMTNAAIKQLIAQGVADALAEIKANRTSRNGNDSHDLGTCSRRTERVARECTYSDFLKCQPLNFKGTKRVVSLTQWFEKMEYVFHISNCTVACQIKFDTSTLLGSALTWWNSYVKTIGHDNLKVKGTNVLSYTQHFQDLALMCSRMFPEESDEVEKYVGGLPDMIQGSVMASKPKIMQDAIEFSTELMDQKIRSLANRQVEKQKEA